MGSDTFVDELDNAAPKLEYLRISDPYGFNTSIYSVVRLAENRSSTAAREKEKPKIQVVLNLNDYRYDSTI